MTPEESLILALKVKDRIVLGTTTGSINGVCSVSSKDKNVRAIANTPIPAGECVAVKTDSGEWYALPAKASELVQSKTIYKRKSKEVPKSKKLSIKTLLSKLDLKEWDFTNIETSSLFYAPELCTGGGTIAIATKMEFFIGGDREPELIYTLPLRKEIDGITYEVNTSTISAKLNNTGLNESDWVVSISWKYKLILYPCEYIDSERIAPYNPYLSVEVTADRDLYGASVTRLSTDPKRSASRPDYYVDTLPFSNGTRLCAPSDFKAYRTSDDVFPSDYLRISDLDKRCFNLIPDTLIIANAATGDTNGVSIEKLLAPRFRDIVVQLNNRQNPSQNVVFNAVESDGRSFKASISGVLANPYFFASRIPSTLGFYEAGYKGPELVSEVNWRTYAVTISPTARISPNSTEPLGIKEYSFEESSSSEQSAQSQDTTQVLMHEMLLLGYGAIATILDRPNVITSEASEILSKTPKLNEIPNIPFLSNRVISYSTALQVHLGETWIYDIGELGFFGRGTSVTRDYRGDGTALDLYGYRSRNGMVGNSIPFLSASYSQIEDYKKATTYIYESRIPGESNETIQRTQYKTFNSFDEVANLRFAREVQKIKDLATTGLKDTRQSKDFKRSLVPRIEDNLIGDRLDITQLAKKSGFFGGELCIHQLIESQFVGSFFVAKALIAAYRIVSFIEDDYSPINQIIYAINPLSLYVGVWNYRKRSVALSLKQYLFYPEAYKQLTKSAEVSLDSSADGYYRSSTLPTTLPDGVPAPTWLIEPNPAKPVGSASFATNLVVYTYEAIAVNEREYSFFIRSAIKEANEGYDEEKCLVAIDRNGIETVIPETSYDGRKIINEQLNAPTILRWLDVIKKGNLVGNYFYMTQWVELLDFPKDYLYPIRLFRHEAFCIRPFVTYTINGGTPRDQEPLIALGDITFSLSFLDRNDKEKWVSPILFCDSSLVRGATYQRVIDPLDPSRSNAKSIYTSGVGETTWTAIYAFGLDFKLESVSTNEFVPILSPELVSPISERCRAYYKEL